MTNELAEEVERLRDRLDRERKARRQAEVIAERGMRELWVANRELQSRADSKSDAVIAGLVANDLVCQVRRREADRVVSDLIATFEGRSTTPVAALLARANELAEVAPLPAVDVGLEFALSVSDVAELVVRRWQRPTARAGLLLTTESAGLEGELTAPWATALAAIDVVVGWLVAECDPGAVVVRVECGEQDVVVEVTSPLVRPSPEFRQTVDSVLASWPTARTEIAGVGDRSRFLLTLLRSNGVSGSGPSALVGASVETDDGSMKEVRRNGRPGHHG